jgi:hypothetical protein
MSCFARRPSQKFVFFPSSKAHGTHVMSFWIVHEEVHGHGHASGLSGGVTFNDGLSGNHTTVTRLADEPVLMLGPVLGASVLGSIHGAHYALLESIGWRDRLALKRVSRYDRHCLGTVWHPIPPPFSLQDNGQVQPQWEQGPWRRQSGGAAAAELNEEPSNGNDDNNNLQGQTQGHALLETILEAPDAWEGYAKQFLVQWLEQAFRSNGVSDVRLKVKMGNLALDMCLRTGRDGEVHSDMSWVASVHSGYNGWPESKAILRSLVPSSDHQFSCSATSHNSEWFMNASPGVWDVASLCWKLLAEKRLQFTAVEIYGPSWIHSCTWPLKTICPQAQVDVFQWDHLDWSEQREWNQMIQRHARGAVRF